MGSTDPYEKEKKKAKDEDRQKLIETKQLADKYERLFLKTEEATKEDGREVLQDLFSRCHVFNSTMTGNSWTYFREGERNIGLQLLEMLDIGRYEQLDLLRVEPKEQSEDDILKDPDEE